MEPFAGTIDELCKVNPAKLVSWLAKTPVEEWRNLRDATWRDWGPLAGAIVFGIMNDHFEGLTTYGFGMWMMEPGQVHPMHTDEMPAAWIVRVHVPIVTNDKVTWRMGKKVYHLDVGKAYRTNPTKPHEIRNDGETKRLHLVFDVLRHL